MATRLLGFKGNVFMDTDIYYETVLNNPKANKRIKKKAKDILDEFHLAGQREENRALGSQMSFKDWYSFTRRAISKRNIGVLGKRPIYNNPLKTSYRHFIQLCKAVDAILKRNNQ